MASSGPFATLMHFLYVLSTTTDSLCYLHLCPYPVGCPVSVSSRGGTEVTRTMPECLDSSGYCCGTPPAQGSGSLRLCPHVQENQLPPEKFTATTGENGPKDPLTHQGQKTERQATAAAMGAALGCASSRSGAYFGPQPCCVLY